MKIAAEISAFILSDLASDRADLILDQDDDLVVLGIVDSLGIMTLADFLEKTYEIRISELDMVPDNFSSIVKIERFLSSKGVGGDSDKEKPT